MPRPVRMAFGSLVSKATVATEKANMHSTLYTPEMSAQTDAVVNAWTGLHDPVADPRRQLLRRRRCWRQSPDSRVEGEGSTNVEADGINDLVAEVKAKAPKPIPKKTVLDLSTGLPMGQLHARWRHRLLWTAMTTTAPSRRPKMVGKRIWRICCTPLMAGKVPTPGGRASLWADRRFGLQGNELADAANV